MRTESLKILAGVLALGRFTKDELAAFSKVKRTTVSSWLNRHPTLFERLQRVRHGHQGRPREFYALRPKAAERLRTLFSSVQGALIEDAFKPNAAAEPVSLKALDRASFYRELLARAKDDHDHKAALEWFQSWVAAARRQASSYQDVGLEIAPGQLELLTTFEKMIEDNGCESFQIENIDASFELLGREIFAEATKCLDQVEIAPHRFDPPVLPLASVMDDQPDVGSVGLLAALGLLEKLPVNRDVRLSIHKRVASIGTENYLASLRELFKRPVRDKTSEAALLAVLNGIRRYQPLIENKELASWLDHKVGAGQWRGLLPGACVIIRLEMPNAVLNDFINQTASTIDTGASIDCHFGGDIDDRFEDAVAAIGRDVADFGSRLLDVNRCIAAASDVFGRFAGIFGTSAEACVPEEAT